MAASLPWASVAGSWAWLSHEREVAPPRLPSFPNKLWEQSQVSHAPSRI